MGSVFLVVMLCLLIPANTSAQNVGDLSPNPNNNNPSAIPLVLAAHGASMDRAIPTPREPLRPVPMRGPTWLPSYQDGRSITSPTS